MCEESMKNLDDELFDIESVLKKYKRSKLVMDKYFEEVKTNEGFYRPLFKKERKAIVAAITDWMVFKGILLRRSDYSKIVDNIKNVFPKEAGFIYYKPPRFMISSKDDVDEEISANINTNSDQFSSGSNNNLKNKSKQQGRRINSDVMKKTPPTYCILATDIVSQKNERKLKNVDRVQIHSTGNYSLFYKIAMQKKHI